MPIRTGQLRSCQFASLLAFLIPINTSFAQTQVSREKVFDVKDLDRDGLLDKEEFSGGSIGKMRTRSDTEFDRKDLDKDGKLSVAEFLKGAKWTKEESRERRREDFGRLDTDGDEEIAKEQYVDGKQGVALRYAEDRFSVIDKDNDGVITEDEYVDQKNLWEVPRIMFQFRDKNRDAKLSMDEFIAPDKGKAWESDRRIEFKAFDENNNRHLSVDEFVALETLAIRNRKVSGLPDDEQHFAFFNTENSDTVSTDEFVALLSEQGHSQSFGKKLVRLIDRDYDNQLTKREMGKLATDPSIVFVIRDANGDGNLTLSEQLNDRLGMPISKWKKESLKKHFKFRDLDRNSTLSQEEFAMIEKDRRVIFLKRDADQDDIVTLEEQLAGMKKKSGDNWRKKNFRGHDFDRDGVVTREEFVVPDDDPRVKFGHKDLNVNGMLSLQEYLANANEKWRPMAERLFQLHDQDRDGYLSVEEFSASDEKVTEDRRIRGLAPEERAFARLDSSRDSQLSMDEFSKRAKRVASNNAYEKQLFDTLDNDRNKALNLNEFLSLDERIPRIQFARCDVDCSGDVTFEEYARFEPQGADDAAKLAFKEFDLNADKTLSKTEFVQLEDDRPSRERMAWLMGLVSSPTNWLTMVVVLFDIALVFFVGRVLIRKLRSQATASESSDGKQAS